MSIEPETELERRIMADPDWREGAAWGKPRRGHPEGTVAAHIEQVLANVDRCAIDPDDRRRLRLVAIVHDTLKHKVNHLLPFGGRNDHAALARKFAERYIEDETILTVIELHDEAYRAWKRRDELRANRLIDWLGDQVGFYRRFHRCDNETGNKSPDDRIWFDRLCEKRRAA